MASAMKKSRTGVKPELRGQAWVTRNFTTIWAGNYIGRRSETEQSSFGNSFRYRFCESHEDQSQVVKVI
jgi:hypothetical protein